MASSRDDNEWHMRRRSRGGKWPAGSPQGVRGAKEVQNGPQGIAAVCNSAAAALDARLSTVMAEAAHAASRSCAYSAAGDLLRTFQWDAHATALGRNVKSLARAAARWRQRSRMLRRGCMPHGTLFGGVPPRDGS